MQRLALACLLLLATAQAASVPVYITAGAMRCGAIRRAVDQVQVWCWAGLVYNSTTAKVNSVIAVPDGKSVNHDYTTDGDTVRWKFTLGGTILEYTVTGNDSPPVIGNL